MNMHDKPNVKRKIIAIVTSLTAALVAIPAVASGQAHVSNSQAANALPIEAPPFALGAITSTDQDGAPATWYTKVNLTAAQLAKIRAGHYRGAFLNHTASPFMSALIAGAVDAFHAMNIQMVAVTNSNMSPALQAEQVKDVLALKPNIILSLAIDPVSGAAAFEPAVKAGVKLVFLSDKPNSYVDGKQDVGVVSYDVKGLGVATADALGNYLHGLGQFGYIYYAQTFWVTNEREAAFLQRLKTHWPGIKIVDRAPMANEDTVQPIVSAMVQLHPNIQAIFVPWDTPPTEEAVAALQAAHKPNIKIFTIDLGGTDVLNMATCGNVYEETSTLAWEFGYSAAIEGALGVLGAPAPRYVAVPALPIEKSNLVSGWKATFNGPLPQNIAQVVNSNHCSG
jgi:ribose transport system substrate-binding protein